MLTEEYIADQFVEGMKAKFKQFKCTKLYDIEFWDDLSFKRGSFISGIGWYVFGKTDSPKTEIIGFSLHYKCEDCEGLNEDKLKRLTLEGLQNINNGR